MCEPSVIAEDWVTKGFHIHMNGVELSVRPDHLQGVKFVPTFSRDGGPKLSRALKQARRCLGDERVRRRWLQRIAAAKDNFASQQGDLRRTAMGRLAELHFVQIAIIRYGA